MYIDLEIRLKPIKAFPVSLQTVSLVIQRSYSGIMIITLRRKAIMLRITVKPVLETTCIEQSPALRDQCSDTALLLEST